MHRVPLAAILLLAACGSSAPADGKLPPPCTKAAALQTVTSATGAYTFYVCSPATPTVGEDTFSYLVVDSSGAPQDGLDLSVQPWMPYMNHGAPGDGNATVTSIGSGQYAVTSVVFQMAGEWQLRTTISAPTSDSANPQFNVN
jgi:hypothetical protein